MDVPELGARGDGGDVAAGYGRNFLLPRQLAVMDTPGNARKLAEDGKLSDVRDRKERGEAEKVAEWLGEHDVFVTLKVGGEGKAFGAVTSKDLAIQLRLAGLDVDRRRIALDAPIKRLGAFEVPLVMHADVDTKIRVLVDRQGGSREGAQAHQAAWDAEAQAAEEAARAEAEARAEREKQAEEATRIALERAAVRRAREEELAKQREEELARTTPVDAEEGEEPAARSKGRDRG
jgi:large subunit ribosomal protein L9